MCLQEFNLSFRRTMGRVLVHTTRRVAIVDRLWFYTKRCMRIGIVMLLCSVLGCRRPVAVPPFVTFLGAWWLQPDDQPQAEREFQEFTRKTGIAIQQSPIPNTLFSSLDPPAQLDLLRKVLHKGESAPDILGIDVIWPASLADDLVDLRPYLSSEISSQDSNLVANYTVQGKVVAIPFRTHVGVLAYRIDLLQRYGYSHPPKTWDELESMAARIQAGERARGRKNFWGYVWQGAATEGLTCNALEWQAAEGGGRVVEDDQSISINNTHAVRAWERAAHWVGRISPPGVVSYRETDSLNVWNSGNAAFLRSWEWADHMARSGKSPMQQYTGLTSMPGDGRGQVSALGGYGLAVPRSSAHLQEAIALIRFLLSMDLQGARVPANQLPRHFENLPRVLQPPDPSGLRSQQIRLVSRPADLTGDRYQTVTEAYSQAVHSVLTGQKTAPDAAAELEKRLVQVTGLRTAPPPARK
ncbi:extracellular solute-binding protein [Granulicella aggregans]|uniref:extracellular solute-binding protein n=1 Tax=Granulicella aggregans TaxID=474949 RepID=UPI0032B261A2